MSSRRHHEGYYDTQPVAPLRDPYKVWVPHAQSESDRPRYKTATGRPENVEVASGRRHGEAKHHSSSRPDTAPAVSSYHNTAISSSSKTLQSSSRPSVPYISGKQPSQVASSTSQARPHTQTPSRSHTQRPQPESYDPRFQNRTTGPSPQSSYEKVSGAENGQKATRPVRSGNGQILAGPSATPTAAPAIWVPPPQVPSSSSRRHREKETEKESMRYREKAYDRSDRYREKERDKDEADVRRREREKMREREGLRERENKEIGYREKGITREKQQQKERARDTLEGKKDRPKEPERPKEWERDIDERERKYRPRDQVTDREHHPQKRKEGEREARVYGDPERVSKPSSSSARKTQDYRVDDPDSSDSARRKPVVTSSGHRRRHTDEGISSTSVDRRHRGERSQPLISAHGTMGLGSSTTTFLALGTTLPTRNDAREVPPEDPSPPTPRVMPVYLPDKKSKPHRSHHAAVPSLPADIPQSGLSGSDTDRAKRRELRHPVTNHSSNLRGHHLEGSARTLEDKPYSLSSRLDIAQLGHVTEMPTTRVSPAEPQKESKGLSSRWLFGRSRQSSVPKPPENRTEGSLNTPLPAEKYRERSVAQEFVSIRAGQGPSDPQISDVLYKPSASSRPEDQTKPPISHRPPLHPQDSSRFYDTQRPDTVESTNNRLPTSNVEHTLIPASESSANAPNLPPAPLRSVRHQSSSRHLSTVVASQRLGVVPAATQPSRSTSHSAIPGELRPPDRAPVLSKATEPAPPQISSRTTSYNDNFNNSRTSGSLPVNPVRQTLPPTPLHQTAPATPRSRVASASSYATKLNESQPRGTSIMASGPTRHSPSSAPLATAASTGPSHGVSKETQSRERPGETLSALQTPKLSSRTGSTPADSLETRPSDPPTAVQVYNSLPAAAPVSTPAFQSAALSKHVDNARSVEAIQPSLSVREQVKVYETQAPYSARAPVGSLPTASRQYHVERNAISTPTVQTEPMLAYNQEAGYTPVGSKRDAWEAPQISVSASQSTPQTTNYRSSKPAEPSYTPVGLKRDIGETLGTPQISASASASASQTTTQNIFYQYPKPSEPNHIPTDPKRDLTVKTSATAAPQIYVSASQTTPQITAHNYPKPSEVRNADIFTQPSLAEVVSKRDTGEVPQIFVTGSQTTAQINYHTSKPTEANYTPVGSKRDLGEKTVAPQIPVSASHTAVQTHFQHHPKPSPSSTPGDSKRDLVEKGATPQLSATPLQTMPRSPHHHSKVSDVTSPTSSLTSARDIHAPTLPASGSKYDLVEGASVPGFSASASQTTSLAKTHVPIKPSEVIGLSDSSKINTHVITQPASKDIGHKNPGPQPFTSQTSSRSVHDQGKPEMRSSALATEMKTNAPLQPPSLVMNSKRELAEKHTAPQTYATPSQAVPKSSQVQVKLPDSRPVNFASDSRSAPVSSSKMPFNEDSPPRMAPHSQTQPLPASHNATSRTHFYETLSSDPSAYPSASATIYQSMPAPPSPSLPRRSPLYTHSNDVQLAEQSQPSTSATLQQHIPPRETAKETGVSSTPTSRDTPSNAVSTLHSILYSDSHSRTLPSLPVSQPPPMPHLYAQPNDNRNAGQSNAIMPASVSTTQDFPPQPQSYYDTPSNVPAAAFMSRQTPSPISKPLMHQTNSTNMPLQASSRNNETPRTPQPSTSRIQEGAKKTHEDYLTSSGATRSTPKSYVSASQHVDLAARTREAAAGQSNPHSHRPGPSTSHYTSSQQASSTTHRHQHTVSLPSSAGLPDSVLTSQTGNSRQPSHTLPRSSVPSTQAVSTSTRVPASNYLSVPQIERSASSDSELLKTPSSLAPSMLLKPISSAPTPVSSQTPLEHGKGNSFTRPRSKKPGQDSSPYEIWGPPASTKTTERNEIRSQERPQERPPEQSSTRSKPTLREKPLAPINIPIRPSGRKSPEQQVFTPFRLFTSRRHRTISAASVDATDGTATNTLIGSPTSIHSQALMPPPFRDPLAAAHEWRNNEEAQMKGRRTGRRRRPGVTFDIGEDHPEDYRNNKGVE